MTAASVNLQGTEPTNAQEGLRSQVRAWADQRLGSTDAFDAIFSRSLDSTDMRFQTPPSARGSLAEAQVSPLGPQAAERLAESRTSATNLLGERDVHARQAAGASQPRLSEHLADAHRRQVERGTTESTAAEVASTSAAGEAGRAAQTATGERATTSSQQAEASSARSDAGNRGSNSGPSTGSTENNASSNGRSAGQQTSSQGNAAAVQAQGQTANASGSTSSGAVGRAGAVAPVGSGPAGATTSSGGSQNSALNFSQALQGAKGSNAATKTATATRSDTMQRFLDVDSKSLVQGVSRGLFAAVKQSGGSLTMRLHPSSLGQLKIEMSIQGNNVTADITTTTEQAQQLLTDSLTALRSALESKGLTVTQLNVNHSPQTTAATQAPHSSQPGAEQEGSNPQDPDSSQGTQDSRQGSGAEDGGDGGERDDQSESQGGGSFTWHIPVPDPGAERTLPTNDGYVVSALNVVA
jgi:flagellar hook-length control protein FliK